MPRVQVIRALGFSNRALSAYEIHDAIITSNGKIDVVSVYRILATLQEVGLIHHIGVVDGYLPCRLEDAHTADLEHLVCEGCSCVTELSLPPSVIKAITEQGERTGFKVTGITIEILGLCTHCRGD
jgi:Fe2+ or Zn2+ uptake regulation protein